ncbi:hypothetical protein CU044_0619 [Streptomyces sp. L-9-10]|nr:hypothetical protein CU044_0619 [Streptomyces sp. L-9-10]
MGLEVAQPAGDRPSGVHLHPDGECVDEETEDVLGPRQIRRTPRHRRTEHHIRRPRVLRQHQRPRALHHRVHGQPVTPYEAGHPCGDLGRHVHRDPLAGSAAACLLRCPVEGQGHRVTEPGQRGTPVLATGLLVLVRQPAHVVTEQPTRQRRPPGGRRPGLRVGVRSLCGYGRRRDCRCWCWCWCDWRLRVERRVLGDHIRQQRRVAPAVQQQMMERPHHPDRVVRQPREGDAQQGSGRQVHAPLTVLGEEVPQQRGLFGLVDTGPVHPPHREADATVHHLHRLRDVVPHQRHPQRVRALHDPLPRLGQPVEIDGAFESEGELLQIGGGLGLGQRVEEHARLQRGQRIDVLHIPAVAGDPVHLGLVEPYQGEVRGSAASRAGLRAVLGERHQFRGEVLGDAANRLLPVRVGGVDPGENEPAVLDGADDIEQVRAALGRCVVPALAGQRLPEQTVGGVTGHIELPVVVEADPRIRLPGRRTGQITQRSVSDTTIGHGPKLLLHQFDRRGPVAAVPRQREGDGVDRGEPADGTRQIGVVEDLLTTVPLQIDRDPVVPRPGTECARQGGKQDVIGVGAIDGGDIVKQRPRLLRRQLHRDGALGSNGVVTIRVVDGQPGDRSLGDRSPVGDLVVEATARGVLGEPHRPLPYGGALGPQVGLPAGHDPLVCRGQVLHQHAQRHAVHHQVVRDDREPGTAGAGALPPEHDADERTVLQVEPGLGVEDECVPAPVGVERIRQLMDLEHGVHTDRGPVVGVSATVLADTEREPEGVMLGQYGRDGRT